MLSPNPHITEIPIKQIKTLLKLSPKLIEGKILRNFSKRSLSPYLQRKIQDNSYVIYHREQSPSVQNQEQNALNNLNKLPFIFPNKEGNKAKNLCKKEMKALIGAENQKQFKRFDMQINNFEEKIERLIALSKRNEREHKIISQKVKEKVNRKENSSLGRAVKMAKENYEINEISKEFKRLVRKIGTKKQQQQQK